MKKLAYISDQKFFYSKEEEAWYTSASFPAELIDIFDDVDEWIFFGRLYKKESNTNLFMLDFNTNKKIKYIGTWQQGTGISGYLKNFFNYYKKLREVIQSSDILYLKFSFIASYLVAFVPKALKKDFITHLVGDIECVELINKGRMVRIISKIEKIIYKHIIKSAKVQFYVSKQLEEKYGGGKGLREIVCENRMHQRDIFKKDKLKSKASFNTIKLLFVGRISVEKGLETVISAIATLDFVTLDVIGNGDYENRLRNLIKAKGIESKVNFLGYVQWGAELFDRYKNYDYLILPSLTEGLPLVIVEAMSKGLPVIASNVGGIPEIINNEKNGLIFEKENYKDLHNILVKIKNNQYNYDSLAKNALETANFYSLENQLNIFSTTLKKSGVI